MLLEAHCCEQRALGRPKRVDFSARREPARRRARVFEPRASEEFCRDLGPEHARDELVQRSEEPLRRARARLARRAHVVDHDGQMMSAVQSGRQCGLF